MKIEAKPLCATEQHVAERRPELAVSNEALENAARIFRSFGEIARFRLLARLAQAPACVTELAELEGESITTISQRLRVLRGDRVVNRRREGKHVIYFLADQHILDLISNGIAHAAESSHSLVIPPPFVPRSNHLNTFLPKLKNQGAKMTTKHEIHENHTHQHGKDCGHTAIVHEDHTDYLHDGHLHSLHEGHVDEHTLAVNATNPADCTNGHDCDGHDADHKHGKDCGHEAVPHGDHVDYLVNGHLHHPDGDHCDNHGPVTVVS